MKRKRSVERKAVQPTAACQAFRRDAVLPLIEKSTGFLPRKRVDHKSEPGLRNLQLLRCVAEQHSGGHFQPFKLSHLYVVSLNYCPGLEFLDQKTDDQVLKVFCSLGQSLKDQDIAVTIDDQRGQKVPFGINEPVRICVRSDIAPALKSGAKPPAPPFPID